MKPLSNRAIAICLVLSIAAVACASDPDEDPDPDPPPSLYDPPVGTPDERLAAVLGTKSLFLVAAASSGSGFFDNTMPCVRRGVINYHDIEQGRHAELVGCDLGAGVTIDGSGDFIWSGTDQNNIESIAFSGDLAVTIDGQSTPALTDFTIDALSYSRSAEARTLGTRLQLTGMQVTLRGQTVTIDEATLPGYVFDSSSFTLATLANPGGDPVALTATDQRRIALHAGMYFFRLFFGEALEASRGDHVHDDDWGTTSVTYDESGIPTLTMSWSQLDYQGTIVDGDFTVAVAGTIPPDFSTVPLVVSGDLALGGGLPEVHIERLDWTIEAPAELPGQARVFGDTVGATQAVPFDVAYTVDD